MAYVQKVGVPFKCCGKIITTNLRPPVLHLSAATSRTISNQSILNDTEMFNFVLFKQDINNNIVFSKNCESILILRIYYQYFRQIRSIFRNKYKVCFSSCFCDHLKKVQSRQYTRAKCFV